jgi:hypothetical protein
VSDSDALRHAAEVLREAARRATPGKWGVGNGDVLASDVEQTSRGSFTCRYEIARLSDDRESWLACDADNAAAPADDGRYVALVQPAVGVALADLLDLFAEASTPDPLDLRGRTNALSRLLLGAEDRAKVLAGAVLEADAAIRTAEVTA